MTFCFSFPLIRTLLSAQKYRGYEAIKLLNSCIENNTVLTNKKISTPIRYICIGTIRNHSKQDDSTETFDVNKNSEMVTYSVKNLKTGDIVEVKGKIGDTLMEATANYIPEVHGACGGSRACTTCHMYIDDELQDILPEPLDEEQDMLDKAAFLKPNSRLSCQVTITKEFEGKIFETPIGTVNMAVDAQVSKKH